MSLRPVEARIVTSLPANPVDGEIVLFAADASNNVYWPLRYNAGFSGNAKWHSVGRGNGLYVFSAGDPSVSWTGATGNWVPTGTPGPSLVLALQGVYRASFGLGADSPAAGTAMDIGLAFGSADPDGTSIIQAFGDRRASMARTIELTTTAPNQTVVMRFRYGGVNGTNGLVQRFIDIYPLRVQ